MKKIRFITLEFKYLDTTDSQKKLSLVYNRIFSLAAKRLIEKQKQTQKSTVDIISTQKYTDNRGVN